MVHGLAWRTHGASSKRTSREVRAYQAVGWHHYQVASHNEALSPHWLEHVLRQCAIDVWTRQAAGDALVSLATMIRCYRQHEANQTSGVLTPSLRTLPIVLKMAAGQTRSSGLCESKSGEMKVYGLISNKLGWFGRCWSVPWCFLTKRQQPKGYPKLVVHVGQRPRLDD